MPNPANLQLRYGFEATEGLGNPAVWQDARIRSEGVGAELPTIEDDSIIANAEQPEGLETKIDPSGPWNVNWSPEDHAKAIAAFFTKGAAPVQSPAGVYTHKLAITETAVTFPATIVQEISRDDGRPMLYVATRPNQLQFNAAARSLLNGSIGWVIPRFHTWRSAEAVAIGGAPTLPFLRGLPSYTYLTQADGDIYWKVTSAPSGGIMGVKFKVGAGTTYDGAAVNVTAGTWYDALHLATNEHIGSHDLPVQILFTSLAAYALNDEGKFRRNRAVWAQSLPVHSPLNEIAITILVDAVKFRTRDIAATLTRPVALEEEIGGRFSDNVLEFGQRTASGQLNRRAFDTAMVDRLLRAKSFQLRVDAYGALIGATGVRRRLSLIMLNCKPSGRTPSVAGRAQFDEAINFVAHPSTDGTYPAAVTCELVNSIASLAA